MYARADLPVLHLMAPASSSNPRFVRWVLRAAAEATATVERNKQRKRPLSNHLIKYTLEVLSHIFSNRDNE